MQVCFSVYGERNEQNILQKTDAGKKRYAAYMYLLESGQEPCEDLKKYVKRMSKSIASRLIATNRNAEAAKFIGLGLLTPAAIKSLYENAVNNGNNDIAEQRRTVYARICIRKKL